MAGGQRVVFGQDPNQIYHTFRRTDWIELDRNDVMEAIRADVESYLPLSFPSPRNAPVIGYVRVSGISLEYHAYPINEGLVNVGTIVGPKTRPGA